MTDPTHRPAADPGADPTPNVGLTAAPLRRSMQVTIAVIAVAAATSIAIRVAGHPAAANLLLVLIPTALAIHQGKALRLQARAIQQMAHANTQLAKAHDALLDVFVASVTEVPDSPEGATPGPARKRAR